MKHVAKFITQRVRKILEKPPNQKKRNVTLKTPEYQNRHAGRDFLILANGPSLRLCVDQLKEFADSVNPIIMGANYIDDLFVPDYHAFTNRKRFCTYVNTVHEQSNLLVSPYFMVELVQNFWKRSYEEISFFGVWPGDKGQMSIRDGIVYFEGAMTSQLLIGLAVVMGARKIYLAGFDGYKQNVEANYHYKENHDYKTDWEFLQLANQRTQEVLDSIRDDILDGDANRLSIITPTLFTDYQVSVW